MGLSVPNANLDAVTPNMVWCTGPFLKTSLLVARRPVHLVEGYPHFLRANGVQLERLDIHDVKMYHVVTSSSLYVVSRCTHRVPHKKGGHGCS